VRVNGKIQPLNSDDAQRRESFSTNGWSDNHYTRATRWVSLDQCL